MSIIHKFESAGLGKAPFQFVGVTEKVYQACHGAPRQPGGTCDYCGNGIMECCIIESADGKRFIVGNSCVRKTGDKGLVDTVKREINRQKTANRQEFDNKFIQKYDWALRQMLLAKTEAHPNGYYASQGKTMGDYHLFTYNNSGRTGKVKMIKQFLKSGELVEID